MLGIRRLTKKIPHFRDILKWFKPQLNFRTWLFFVLSLFIVGLGIYFLRQATSAKAAWFDSGFSYRQRIPITNSGSVLTNYQVGFTLNTSALVTAGKLQSDCDDIRIVGEDGSILPHWRENEATACSSDTSSQIWTKLPSVPTTGINIYLYYGNSNAANSENPDGIFEFFDDFDGTTLKQNLWTGQTSNFQVSGGLLIGSTTTFRIQSTTAYSGDYKAITRINTTTYPTNGFMSAGFYGSTANGYGVLVHATDATFRRNNTGWAGSVAFESNQWVRQVITVVGTAASALLVGETTGSILNGDTNTGGISGEPLTLGHRYDGLNSGQAYNAQWDFILVAKAASTEPAVGSFAAEESSQVAVAHWKFDEGSGTTAGNAVEGTIGTLTNGPTWHTKEKCITNNCISFDGTNDYFDTGKDYSWTVTDSFSFSFWIKPTGGTGNQTVFGKGLAGTTWEYSFKMVALAPSFTYWNTSGGGEIQLSSSTDLTLNSWQHVVVTYNSSSAYMYIDGVEVAADTNVGNTLQNRASNLTLGRGYYNSGAGGSFPGFIDEFKIFNSARSESDAKQEFAQGYQGSEGQAILGAEDTAFLSEGLVGHWKMDEIGVSGSNWTAIDSSGNKFNGTGAGNATVGSTVPGRFGNSGYLDGNGDYVSLGTDPTLNPDIMTVSAWIRPNSGFTSDYRMAVARGSGDAGTQRDWQLRTSTSTGNPQFYVYSTAGTGYATTGTTAITASTWSHLVGVYDGTTLYLYVNGSLAAKNTIGAITRNNTTGNTVIGREGNYAGYYHLGGIDDVRIYNRAFTDREVSQLYEWAPAPIVYWALDQNTGTTVNSNTDIGTTGTFGTGGSAPKWGPGKYGSGLEFDGTDDYVNFGDVDEADFGVNDFTISGWIKSTQNASRYPISKRASCGASNFWNLATVVTTGVISIEVSEAGGTNYNYAQSSSSILNDEWHYFTFVRVGPTMYVYVNGKLETTDTAAGTANLSNSNNLQFGENPCTGAASAQRQSLDDVRIYNYARSTKQIVQDMNAGHPAVGSPVASAQAHWKMDEGYGTTINSSGSSTVPGIITGATWTSNGKFEKALDFDGSGDRVAFSSAAALNTIEGTVSFWVNSDQNQANPAYAFAHPQTGDNSRIYFSFAGDNVIVGRLGTAVTIGSYALTHGKWHHVAMTWNGTSAAFYGDGKNLTTTSTFNGLTSLTATSIIGAINTSGSQSFDGKIDEMKIYNYSLTEDEIRVEYNQGKAIVLGSVSTGVGGTTPSNSASREYCVPGDSASCSAPLAEWKLDENTGATAYDSSGNGRNGTFGTGGSAPKWANGIEGPAVYFDGTQDVIDTSSEISLSSATSFTVSGWIKPTALNTTDRYVIDRTTGTNELINIFSTSTDDLSFRLRGDNGAGITSTTAPNVLVVGQWLHFTSVRDVSDDRLKLYINGQFASQATDATTGTNSPIIRIGNHSGAANGWMGMIDQVRIYNYARTPAQIAWEYSKGAPIGHYKMDECEGTTIYNSAPTFNDAAPGNNGTLVIGATSTNTTVGTCSTSGAWADGAVGKRGASMDFDGTDDYVSLGDSSLWELIPPFSLSTWVKAEVLNPTNVNTIASKYNTGSNQREWYLGLYLGRVTFAKYPDGSGTQHGFVGNQTLEEGRWHHVVFTMDENAVGTYYVDGKFDGSGSMTNTTIFKGTAEARIGRLAAGGTANNYFRGLIDEFSIYNYSLTPDQVKVVHNNGSVSFE